MLRSRKIALIAATVLLTCALGALIYFAFIDPPGENLLSGARFIMLGGCACGG